MGERNWPTAGLVRDVLQGIYGFMPDDPSSEWGYNYLVKIMGQGPHGWAYLPRDETEVLSFEELEAIARDASIPLLALLRALFGTDP